jgi:hypothetical protein
MSTPISRDSLVQRLSRLAQSLVAAERAETESRPAYIIQKDIEAARRELNRLDEIDAQLAAEAAKLAQTRVYEAAKQELAAAENDLRALEAAYRSLPDRIAVAQSRFSYALTVLIERKSATERTN